MLIVIFSLLAGGLLALDILTNNSKENTIMRAAIWSTYYIVAALVFASVVAINNGVQDASLFLSGYVLEKVLSLDNLLVFSAVFAYFKIEVGDQYKILKYGIVGAVIARFIFTFIGVGSLQLFGKWTELAFAILVGWSAIAMLKTEEGEEGGIQQWISNNIPSTSKFILCLLSIEISDVMFAFDSVPTVIAVVKNPVLIYTAMIFAILGLRSMYFLLVAVQEKLIFVEKAVIGVLMFISTKLFLHSMFDIDISPLISFAIIISTLTVGVMASLLNNTQEA